MQSRSHPPVSRDRLGQDLLIRGFDQLVHELGGQGVFDPELVLGCDGAQCDEQMALAGAGVRAGQRREDCYPPGVGEDRVPS